MLRKGGTQVPNTNDEVIDEMVAQVAACIAPTIEEVADWHFVDQALSNDWDRPLVRLLRFFAEPAPLADRSQVKLSDCDTIEKVDADVVVDLVTSEILDLTRSIYLDEELAS